MIQRDESGNILPQTFSTATMVMCMQLNKRYPGDAQFWSPLVSDAEEVTFMEHDFYRMIIMICRESMSDKDITIPLLVRTSCFNHKPNEGEPIHELLWLQGKQMKKKDE